MQAVCLDCKRLQKIVEIERYANGLYALRCDDCLTKSIMKEEAVMWKTVQIKARETK